MSKYVKNFSEEEEIRFTDEDIEKAFDEFEEGEGPYYEENEAYNYQQMYRAFVAGFNFCKNGVPTAKMPSAEEDEEIELEKDKFEDMLKNMLNSLALFKGSTLNLDQFMQGMTTD